MMKERMRERARGSLGSASKVTSHVERGVQSAPSVCLEDEISIYFYCSLYTHNLSPSLSPVPCTQHPSPWPSCFFVVSLSSLSSLSHNTLTPPHPSATVVQPRCLLPPLAGHSARRAVTRLSRCCQCVYTHAPALVSRLFFLIYTAHMGSIILPIVLRTRPRQAQANTAAFPKLHRSCQCLCCLPEYILLRRTSLYMYQQPLHRNVYPAKQDEVHGMQVWTTYTRVRT
jgi:hypothetical protein